MSVSRGVYTALPTPVRFFFFPKVRLVAQQRDVLATAESNSAVWALSFLTEKAAAADRPSTFTRRRTCCVALRSSSFAPRPQSVSVFCARHETVRRAVVSHRHRRPAAGRPNNVAVAGRARLRTHDDRCPGPGQSVRAARPAHRLSRHNRRRQDVQLRQETGVRPQPE